MLMGLFKEDDACKEIVTNLIKRNLNRKKQRSVKADKREPKKDGQCK